MQQITEEFCQKYMKCADPLTGPAYFLEHVLQWQLYDYHHKQISNILGNRLSCNVMFRRSGKTKINVGLALWKALFSSMSSILFLTPNYVSADSSKFLIKKYYDQLPAEFKIGIIRDSKSEIVFANGSIIRTSAITPHVGRGLSTTLVLVDELSNPAYLQYIIPCISNSGHLGISSSLNSSMSSILYDQSNFSVMYAKWTDHPNANQRDMDNIIRHVGKDLFEREYMCGHQI